MGQIKDKLAELSNPIYTYDQLCKFLGASTGGAVLLMCLGDIYVHPTLAESVPKNRRLLKVFLDQFMKGADARDIVSHIGNSFLSAAPAIAITMVGEICRYYGEKSSSKYLVAISNAAPFVALATVGAANWHEEMGKTQLDPVEARDDLKYGVIAGGLSIIATICSDIPRVLTKHSTPPPLRFQPSPAHITSHGRSLASASC